jgi:hypothetical protein
MLYLKDKGDNWSTLSPDCSQVIWEDGLVENITTNHLEIEIGKYKGETLGAISDKPYLMWMLETAKEEDLQFVARMLEKRIKQII